jgi:hypothetical protein
MRARDLITSTYSIERMKCLQKCDLCGIMRKPDTHRMHYAWCALKKCEEKTRDAFEESVRTWFRALNPVKYCQCHHEVGDYPCLLSGLEEDLSAGVVYQYMSPHEDLLHCEKV